MQSTVCLFYLLPPTREGKINPVVSGRGSLEAPHGEFDQGSFRTMHIPVFFHDMLKGPQKVFLETEVG